MSKKSKTAQFRITGEEDAHLRQAAEDAGMKLSDYLRAVALHPTVVVVTEERVVLIPSTVTTAEADERLQGRFEAILAQLKSDGQGESPAPTPGSAQPLPAQPPTGAPQPAPASAPGSPPAATPPTSPGEPADGMVGSSLSAPAAGVSLAPAADPGEAACPNCGGRDGRHQSYCETLTGESPVEDSPPPGQETMDDYVERRVGEGELAVVAEAEWRQRAAAPPAAEVDRRVACPSCGAMKLPEAQCADCGRRPG